MAFLNMGDDDAEQILLISLWGLGPILYTLNHRRAYQCQVGFGDQRVLPEWHVRDRDLDLEWESCARR